MDELEVMISASAVADVREELELEAADRDGHLAGFLCVLLDDTVMTEIEGTPTSGPAVRFRMYTLDWARIKTVAADAFVGVEWSEAPLTERRGRTRRMD